MPTALITGASSGIGLEIARELARRKYDLILVARREDKLREAAGELENLVKVQIIPADLSQPNAASELFSQLKDQSVDILVNNAGFGDYGYFHESDEAKMRDMLAVNITTLTELTRLILPGMVSRGSGRILNVASVVAFFPGPLMAVYYASKAYVLSFSESLANEMEGTGVTVTCLCPGPTKSGFQEHAALAGSKLMDANMMDATTVAQAGVKALLRGQTLVIPGRNNVVLTQLHRFMPRKMLTRMIRRVQERKSG